MGKKTVIVGLVVILLGAALPAAADSQVDIGLHIPYYIGVEAADDEGDMGAALDYAFLVPDVKYNYFFNESGIKIGVGARLFTIILETMAYPIVTLETDVGPFTLSSHVGGGVFLFFGLYNDINTGQYYLPEVSVAYRFSESFSVGTGAGFFFAPEAADFNNFAYIGDVFARFTF
ncbi:MAG: hypothetical protein U5P10_11525 [Spirochaetia bacterium]|nr:hypothetical protein [Spirochaetia bacterium]